MYATANQREVIIELFGPDNLTQQKQRELLEKEIPHRTKIVLDQMGQPHSIIQLTSTNYLEFNLMRKS